MGEARIWKRKTAKPLHILYRHFRNNNITAMPQSFELDTPLNDITMPSSDSSEIDSKV